MANRDNEQYHYSSFEHDPSGDAPEMDSNANAPQVALQTTLEVNRDANLPESRLDQSGKESCQRIYKSPVEEQVAANGAVPNTGSMLKKRWIPIGLALGVVAITVGVGAGVGVGIKHKNSTSSTTTSASPTTTASVTLSSPIPTTTASVTLSSPITTIVTTCLPVSYVNKVNIEKREETASSTLLHTSSTSMRTTSILSPSSIIEINHNAATSTITSPTSTVISTVTSTVISCPTPDTSCNNTGIQYAVWNNSQILTDNTYTNFDPTLYYSDSAEFIGNSTINAIGPIDTGPCDVSTATCRSGFVYSTRVESLGTVLVAHRGYLFAPLNDNYTFSIYNEDNIVLLWTRSVASSGWTRTNTELQYTLPSNSEASTIISTILSLNAGELLPIRVMYANGGHLGTFNFSITTSDGTEIAGSDEQQSPFLVQYSCDGNFPRYPPWNSES